VKKILHEKEWFALRRASVNARGVLADLRFMIESGQTGADIQIDKVTLRMIGISAQEFDACADELVNAGVLVRDGNKVVYPRIKLEIELRKLMKENGKKGGRPKSISVPQPGTL
jgi:hypothetical protein